MRHAANQMWCKQTCMTDNCRLSLSLSDFSCINFFRLSGSRLFHQFNSFVAGKLFDALQFIRLTLVSALVSVILFTCQVLGLFKGWAVVLWKLEAASETLSSFVGWAGAVMLVDKDACCAFSQMKDSRRTFTSTSPRSVVPDYAATDNENFLGGHTSSKLHCPPSTIAGLQPCAA